MREVIKIIMIYLPSDAEYYTIEAMGTEVKATEMVAWGKFAQTKPPHQDGPLISGQKLYVCN